MIPGISPPMIPPREGIREKRLANSRSSPGNCCAETTSAQVQASRRASGNTAERRQFRIWFMWVASCRMSREITLIFAPYILKILLIINNFFDETAGLPHRKKRTQPVNRLEDPAKALALFTQPSVLRLPVSCPLLFGATGVLRDHLALLERPPGPFIDTCGGHCYNQFGSGEGV